jgi:hypothetical protein
VTFDYPNSLSGGGLSRLHLTPQPGAELPASVPLRPGHTVNAAVDPSVVHAIANTAAKGIIAVSNMEEGAEE